MNYKLLENGCVLRLPDNAAIPPTTDNVDWIAYQAWLALGNTPLPADAPIPAIDLSNVDNLDRVLRAASLLGRDYCNALKAEIRGLVVLLVSKGTITYAGTGQGNQKTVADLKTDFAAKYASLT